MFLGGSVDAEADGQPNAAANGDDLALSPDDEDGLNPLDLVQVQGLPASFRFTAYNVFDAASWNVVAPNTIYIDERRRYNLSVTADF